MVVSGVVLVSAVAIGLARGGVFSSTTSGSVIVCQAFQKINADTNAKRHVDAPGALRRMQSAHPQDPYLLYVASHTWVAGDQLAVPNYRNNSYFDVFGICARYGVTIPSPQITDK